MRPYQPKRNRHPNQLENGRKTLRPAEVVALAITSLVAAALILLLASQNILLAVPVALGYAALLWLLYRAR